MRVAILIVLGFFALQMSHAQAQQKSTVNIDSEQGRPLTSSEDTALNVYQSILSQFINVHSKDILLSELRKDSDFWSTINGGKELAKSISTDPKLLSEIMSQSQNLIQKIRVKEKINSNEQFALWLGANHILNSLNETSIFLEYASNSLAIKRKNQVIKIAIPQARGNIKQELYNFLGRIIAVSPALNDDFDKESKKMLSSLRKNLVDVDLDNLVASFHKSYTEHDIPISLPEFRFLTGNITDGWWSQQTMDKGILDRVIKILKDSSLSLEIKSIVSARARSLIESVPQKEARVLRKILRDQQLEYCRNRMAL